MELLIVLACAAATAFVASRKGFNPVIWFFGGGLLSLLVLAFLPSAARVELAAAEQSALRRRGNMVGVLMIGIGVIVGVIASGLA